MSTVHNRCLCLTSKTIRCGAIPHHSIVCDWKLRWRRWEEHLRDFNRTWGSGAILLVGPQQVGALPPAPDAASGEVSPVTAAGPVKIETVLSTFDAEASFAETKHLHLAVTALGT